MTPSTPDSHRPPAGPHRAPGIVPPYLLEHIAEAEDPRFERASIAARRSLGAPRDYRAAREAVPGEPAPGRPGVIGERTVVGVAGRPDRRVSDAGGAFELPGELVRAEGAPPSEDVAVDEAYDGLGDTYALFWAEFGRHSIDGLGLPLEATVHYGRRYDNAFWDGERMVFGDGDGEVFERFTASLSVIGHELAHGFTAYTTPLVYQGQSGALNEHVSDVFGALVEQHAAGQRAEEASWLIGEGLFTAEVEGRALRSMIEPGTAYDDDVLGRDPQPGHLRDYIETRDDNGGVHLNSGIPNRAFALAALELGGAAWERAGRVWYDVMVGRTLAPNAGFAEFAAATVRAAEQRFGTASPERRAVAAGWSTVGLELPAR